MSEINEAVRGRPSLRHRWPKGIWGWVSYFYDHRIWRYRYPVIWHDLALADESMSALMVCANGGVSVFDGIEIDILRELLRGSDDLAIVDAIDVHPCFVANVRAKLRRNLGITTADQLALLACEYGNALKC